MPPGDMNDTINAIQGRALEEALEKIDRIYEIVVGNGTPEKGLTAKVMLLQRDVEEIKRQQHTTDLTRSGQIAEIKTMIEQDRAERKRGTEKTGDRLYDLGTSVVKTVISAIVGAIIALILTGRIHIS